VTHLARAKPRRPIGRARKPGRELGIEADHAFAGRRRLGADDETAVGQRLREREQRVRREAEQLGAQTDGRVRERGLALTKIGSTRSGFERAYMK